MKILAVDDNPMTGILLTDMLMGYGYETFVAKDAKEAMELFERLEPHVCILDWMMPGTDGLQLACAIRTHKCGAGVYIIMLSAKCDLESIGRAYELGVDDFLTKPIASGELKARLHTAARLVGFRDQHASMSKEIASLSAELHRLKAA